MQRVLVGIAWVLMGLLVLAYAFLTYRRSHGDGRIGPRESANKSATVILVNGLHKAVHAYHTLEGVYPEGDVAEVVAFYNKKMDYGFLHTGCMGS